MLAVTSSENHFLSIHNKLKQSDNFVKILQPLAKHLDDLVYSFKTLKINWATLPTPSEENSQTVIDSTLLLINNFIDMSDTFITIDWTSKNLYNSEIALAVSGILLKDLLIIFYYFNLNFSVVINNIYNYLGIAYNKTVECIGKYDSCVQFFTNILKSQSLFDKENLPALHFSQITPLINFAKRWIRCKSNPEKRGDVDTEIDEFVKTFMGDSKTNLVSIKSLLSQEFCKPCTHQKARPTSISTFDSLITNTDSPIFHETCTSPFRSHSTQNVPQSPDITKGKLRLRVKNTPSPVMKIGETSIL
ncbi:hypothetical protein EIN_405240 [Entamoeba invadens IP1]|uniref:Uncharacterized protein n=1 Tax=Entamoeba invadens IP1 TaxID=370355 RepID=A0A0A1U711_ENTIV|nr:hypothetical protein EIN_405240 [Entamoeba invadens IP1]ELP90110.1 hypothetical protein EIN_405240 [Entamoeba invadens IP1]|eukprot:XP_004256881.1 hypothetical protein EIN_405240 [Entamoeba invadens IP1]